MKDSSYITGDIPPSEEGPQKPHPDPSEPKAPEAPLLEGEAADAFDNAFFLMIDLLRSEYSRGYFSIYRLFPVASLVLGKRVEVGNASRYIYHFARSQGYDIPPYPLSSSGEIKQFFADESVTNVPEWYEKIGVTAEEYEHIHEYTVVSVRGRHADRIVFLIHLYMGNWPRFVPLEESQINRYLGPQTLARLLSEVMEAALSDSQTPSANPTIHLRRFKLKQ